MLFKRVVAIGIITALSYSNGITMLYGSSIETTCVVNTCRGTELPQNIVTAAPFDWNQNQDDTSFGDTRTIRIILIAGVAGGLGFAMLDPARSRNQVGFVVAFGSYGLLSLIRNSK